MHTKTSGKETCTPCTYLKMVSFGEVNVVVQQYDRLYNRYSKSYKDKHNKMNCWLGEAKYLK